MEKKPSYKELQQKVSELEKKLKQKEDIESIIEQCHFAIQVYDENGFRIGANQAFEDFWHIKRDKDFSNYNILNDPNVKKSGQIEYLKQAYAGEVVKIPFIKIDPTLYRRPVKETFWLEAILYPVFSSSGILRKVIIIHQDVTEHKIQIEKLNESEDRFRNIIENSLAGYFFIDAEGLFQDVNQAFLDMYGYSEKTEILGKHFSKTQINMDLKEAQAIVKRLLVGEIFPSGEFSRLNKDGSVGYHTFSAQPVKEGDNIVGLEGFLIDITDHKRAENELLETHKKLKTSIENMPDAYIICDQEARVIEWNKAAEKIFGYSKEEMLGKKAVNYIAPKGARHLVESVLQKLKAGEFASYTEKDNNIRKDGSLISCKWYNTPLVNGEGKVIGILSIGQDVTEKLRAEEELRQNEAKFREANNIKELLLDIITHDLKNSGGAIHGLSELLLDDYPDEVLAASIMKVSNNLLNVVENVSALSKVSMGEEVEMEEIELGSVILSSKKEYESLIKVKKIQFENKIKQPIHIQANPIISEVFKNYFSNAIKYAAKGKRIVVQSKEDDNYITIYVKDYGTTISKDMRELIFERTIQLKKNKTRGKGLGLAIVKRIAMAHGFEVGVVPNKPDGNKFYLKIPK